MRVLLQRVSEASVQINHKIHSNIGAGILVLLGIENADDETDITWLVNKIVQLRVFPDDEGKMNRSVQDISGEVLIVSQFTLHARVKKGARPSFTEAAKPNIAIPLYNKFIAEMKKHVKTQTGDFGEDMKVQLINDGPVTLWIDSKRRE